MVLLVSLYFSHINRFIPLLHPPRFIEGMNQRLHEHDHGFASTLLLVCALGSLYLTDSTGLSRQDRAQMGRKWYDQVELCGHSFRQEPTLYDLQAYCVRPLLLANKIRQSINTSSSSSPRSSSTAPLTRGHAGPSLALGFTSRKMSVRIGARRRSRRLKLRKSWRSGQSGK